MPITANYKDFKMGKPRCTSDEYNHINNAILIVKRTKFNNCNLKNKIK